MRRNYSLVESVMSMAGGGEMLFLNGIRQADIII